MKEHQGFKSLEVIIRVGGAIIEFGLRHPKLWQSNLAHDLRGERWLCVELSIKRMRRSDFEGL